MYGNSVWLSNGNFVRDRHFPALYDIPMLRTMTAIVAMLWAGGAAACSSDYARLRGARIAETLKSYTPAPLGSYAGTPILLYIGDSHTLNMSQAWPQGFRLINGRKVLFLGISGADAREINECFPWQAAFDARTQAVVFQFGVNDAERGRCCTADGWVTDQYMAQMVALRNRLIDLTPNVTFVTDPPPEQSQGVSPKRMHNVSRVVYYVARDYGARFVDLYSQFWPQDCAPSTIDWIDGETKPCYAPAGATVDYVHLDHAGLARMFDMVRLAP